MNRNLWLLAACQALFLVNNITFIAVNGLVGLSLAPQPWLATLPVAGYVVGAALSAPMVARLQARYGRQRTFMAGLAVGAVSALACALAVRQGSFTMVVAATLLAGFYSANAALYRFAGPELVEPGLAARALSLVLAGGVVGAVVGPNLAAATRSAMPVAFVGSYLALVAVALLGMVLMALIRFPAHVRPPPGRGDGRPMREIARQPAFIVAVAAAALGYGGMNLLMAAARIAMQQCGHEFDRAALVLEWHVLGMFVPSFFTGRLIERFGALPVMFTGALLNLACIAVALSGVDVMQFLVALALLGVGWNFLYVGGSTLLTTTYRPSEKTRAQGAMDTCVFATMAFTSVGAGAVVTGPGWSWLNTAALVPVPLVLAALAWLARHRATQRTAQA